MLKKILLVLLSFFSLTSFAQKFQWANGIGGPFPDAGQVITADDSGNVYTAGNFFGTVDFDPGSGVFNLSSAGTVGGIGDGDIFISKSNDAGKFIWALRIGGKLSETVTSMVLDASNNIYVTGGFFDTANFNPSNTAFDVISQGNADVFIAKFSSSGNLIWVKSMGGSNADQGNSITIDKANNVYLTGSFTGTVDFNPGAAVVSLTSAGGKDIFIEKLDSNGNFIWVKSIGGVSDDVGISISIDTFGYVLSTGTFRGNLDFDPGISSYMIASKSGSIDIYVSELDSAGNFSKAVAIGGTYDEFVSQLTCDINGNFYLTGYFDYVSDFDPGTNVYNLTSVGGKDAFISKYSNSGNLVWARSMGSSMEDRALSVVVDRGGNVYTTGFFRSVADFDPGAGIFNLTSNGFADIFISKLDSSGNLDWAKNIGGANSDAANFINLDKTGNLLITGYFANVCDFDPGFATYNVSSYGNNSDIFNLKLFPCSTAPLQAGTITGISSVCAGDTKSYSINPVSGSTEYVWTVPPGASINSGQNSTSINITFGASSGIVTVTPKNLCGVGSTNSRGVTVNQFPVYTTQPSNKMVPVGTDVLFIGLTIVPALGYQWQQNSGNGFVNLSDAGQYFGSNDDTLQIKDVTLIQNNFSYRCIAKSGACSDTSNTAMLNTFCDLGFLSQPINTTMDVGSDVLFIAVASHTKALIQWQLDSGTGFNTMLNSGIFAGVNDDTLHIRNVHFSQNNYHFRCIISEGGCSDTSITATLSVNCILKLTTQPLSKTTTVGSTLLFTATASSPSTAYQWQVNNGGGFVNVTNTGVYSGATDDSLIITGATLGMNNTKYRCIVAEGGCSDTSITVTLLVNCNLFATTQPNSQTIKVDSTVRFITAVNNPSATFQWQQDGGTGFLNLANAGIYSGVTDDTLTIKNVSYTLNNFKYRCIIAESGCFDTSDFAILTVKTTGIEENLMENKFWIYPNPAQSNITIQSKFPVEEISYSIKDAAGREVVNGKLNTAKTEIEIRYLSNGFYLVLVGEERKQIFKLVKQ